MFVRKKQFFVFVCAWEVRKWLTTVYRRQPDRAHLGTNANQIHRTIYINRCNYKYEYKYKWYKYQTLIQMQTNPFYQLPNSQSCLNIVLSVSFLVWPSSYFHHILESFFGFHCVSSCSNKYMQQSELELELLCVQTNICNSRN